MKERRFNIVFGIYLIAVTVGIVLAGLGLWTGYIPQQPMHTTPSGSVS